MSILSRRAARYARAWIRGAGACEQVEVELDRAGEPVTARLFRPAGAREPLPGWVALHGMTRDGRKHPQLTRFARAVAHSGAAVIVPEVPEWTELSLAPHVAAATVEAGIAGLASVGWARDEPVGVVGFSFGAPHAITASVTPQLSDRVAGAVGFGGYCDIETTFRFMMTGASDQAAGRRVGALTPDPYGRWIVGANYLPFVPDYTGTEDVAAALRALSIHSAEVGAPSWSDAYDAKIETLRAGLAPERRHVFDLFAPTSGTMPPRVAALEVAESLAAAARRIEPSLDPTELLAQVHHPVHILHGRADRLIPHTESAKLAAALSSSAETHLTVTALFGHTGHDRLGLVRAVHEVPRFAAALSRVLSVV